MILSLPLERIDMDHLVRDRIGMDTAEMDTLVASVRARGQQTPIEVVALENGRYGLISGWRRCQALAALQAEGHGDGVVLALLRQPKGASDAYVAMVEENEIRVGLSYFERARIVVRALEQGVFETEKSALAGLFGTASRAKRSKIKSFQTLVHMLDGALKYPAHIGERLGLQLVQRLGQDDRFAAALTRTLQDRDPADATEEQKILSDALSARGARLRSAPRVHVDRPLGQGVAARVHSDGRLELRGNALPAPVRDALIRWLENELAKVPEA
jgi:ParB/RepB/Spo0J family partition protein